MCNNDKFYDPDDFDDDDLAYVIEQEEEQLTREEAERDERIGN